MFSRMLCWHDANCLIKNSTQRLFFCHTVTSFKRKNIKLVAELRNAVLFLHGCTALLKSFHEFVPAFGLFKFFDKLLQSRSIQQIAATTFLVQKGHYALRRHELRVTGFHQNVLVAFTPKLLCIREVHRSHFLYCAVLPYMMAELLHLRRFYRLSCWFLVVLQKSYATT